MFTGPNSMKSRNEHFKTIGHHTEPVVIHVARNGTDLGNINLSVVHRLLSSGELAKADHYFDPSMQKWVTLDSHPEL